MSRYKPLCVVDYTAILIGRNHVLCRSLLRHTVVHKQTKICVKFFAHVHSTYTSLDCKHGKFQVTTSFCVLLGSVLKGLPVTFSMKETSDRFTATLVWRKTEEARKDQDAPSPTGPGETGPTNDVVVPDVVVQKKKKHKSPSTPRRNRTRWSRRRKVTPPTPTPAPEPPKPPAQTAKTIQHVSAAPVPVQKEK